MAETTEIAWADSTFNPWIGCTKVSRATNGGGGCDFCYAEKETPVRVMRGRGIETWGTGAPRQRTSADNWKQPVRWNAQADEFEAQHGRRRRVFCASLADVFDNEVDPAWRADLFTLIEATPRLDWLLLTKRIGNAAKMIDEALSAVSVAMGWHPTYLKPSWPWKHVWIGATIVSQHEADRDITKLLYVDAHVRFVSMEPLLGEVDISEDLSTWCDLCTENHKSGEGGFPGVDWVIVGGESGPNARPMNPAWARDLRDQCAFAEVPFLFKQWGEYSVHEVDARGNIEPGMDMMSLAPAKLLVWSESGWASPGKGAAVAEIFKPGAVIAQRVGKARAGRLLDGVEHNGFPRGAA